MTFRLIRFAPPAAALATFAALTCGPASAHHSFNAYDMTKVSSLSGTVKEFRWGAPHSSMVIMYTDKQGKPAQMSIISGAPLMFVKQGFQPRDFHRGDKVTVTYHPNVNGAYGGSLASLTLPNGHTFTDTEAAAVATGKP